jgi:hypothetical protein
MAMTLIQSQTANSDTTVSFTSGIDSTYPLYIFNFYDINPETDSTSFRFQGNASDQSDYNENLHTVFFYARHDEADSSTSLLINATYDQANATTFAYLAPSIGNGGDESAAGQLWLYNPSSTVYKAHFQSRFNHYASNDFTYASFCGGYFNVAAAITNIQFAMESGDYDGTIKMYGVG